MQVILKGDIVYSQDRTSLSQWKDAYVVCSGGRSMGVFRSFSEIPRAYKAFPVEDYSGRLIVPALYDLHMHAPQYQFRGLGMDLELLDWLNAHAFPNEARYRDTAFARQAYGMFVEDLRRGGTARCALFATLHTDATLQLMELLEQSGLRACVGKVNMDRNAPDELRESTEESIRETKRWLEAFSVRGFRHVAPILTPRFIPSCTDGLMRALGELTGAKDAAARAAALAETDVYADAAGQQEKQTGQKEGAPHDTQAPRLPLQSHLSENQAEIAWVRELCPWSSSYGDAYDKLGCFGENGAPVIMAHCVWSPVSERELMKQRGVYIAHCPASNTDIASGIAPIRRYLEEGQRIGLGTDIAGGFSRSIFRAMADAIQVSKLYWRLCDQTAKSLTLPEVFYLGTKGGGSFFGRCGSLEAGYAFDALVLDESQLRTPLKNLTLEERLERFVYLADERDVLHKFVEGERLF